MGRQTAAMPSSFRQWGKAHESSVTADAVAAGYDMVDAPVSGGIAAANGGTLTFMVGGTDAAFPRAEPILAAMGKAVIHAGASGASGAGQAAQSVNAEVPMGAKAVALYEELAGSGSGALDFSAIIRSF